MNPTTRLACAAVLLGACSSPPKKHQLTQQEMITADPLPLAKGATWTYNVTVKRFDVDADKEVTRTLEWITEVVDAKKAGGVTAYRIKGWPTDLAEFDQAPVATEKTILRSGNNFLFGATAEPTLDGAEGWFSWPMIDGQKIWISSAFRFFLPPSATASDEASSTPPSTKRPSTTVRLRIRLLPSSLDAREYGRGGGSD
jgi:hypothetical protein